MRQGLACPGNPVEGPGPRALEKVAPSSSPLAGGEAALGAGVPPPAASFAHPPPGLCAGAAALFRRLRRVPPSGLDGTVPPRTRWRRGSAAARAERAEVRPRLPGRGTPSFGSPPGWSTRPPCAASASPVTMPASPLAG